MTLRKIETGYTGFFVALLLAGAALIGWGVTQRWILLSSLGGALFGSSVSALVGTLSNDSFLERVNQVLKESLIPGFSSDEDKVKNYRRKFHYYRVTEIDKKFVWRYAVLDFSMSVSIGKLTTVVEYSDGRGNKLKYNVYAGVRDERFFIIKKAISGTESASVALFPYMEKEFFGHHYGVAFRESFGGTHLLAPCIISATPLFSWSEQEKIDDDVAKRLDEEWQGGFNSIIKNLTCSSTGQANNSFNPTAR